MNDEELRRQNEEERRKRLGLIALLALLYTNMEDEMLRVIADSLGTDDFNGDLDSWRIKHLAAAEAVGRKVSRIAGSYANAEKQVFYTAINNAASAEINRVDTAVGQAVGSSAKTASRAAGYFRKQANHDINTVNTVMRYKAKQGYVTAVNSAFFTAKESERIWKALGDNALAVAEGRLSLQSAVRNAIVKMSEKGIPAFIDKAGREWTPEAYVRMDIRSTVGNTARRAQFDRCEEHNINLIEVSAHAGARPLCAPYQGGIYSLDGSSGTVKDAAGREINFTPLSSTSYGQAAGLFGINCGHQSYPFKPGINFRRYYPLETEEEFAENSKRYAEFQKQRAMERSIRASKRECMMCDAAGDKDGVTKASQKLAKRKTAYKEYSKSVGLKQHNDRTQVYGFDKSISAKASWANRKATLKNSAAGLTSGGRSGTIRTGGKITLDNIGSYEKYEKQAHDFYSYMVRNGDFDVKAISDNTNFSYDDILKIKNHMMIDKHLFNDGTISKFSPDIDQALAWQRLIENRYNDYDILLLNHELRELNYINETGCTYEVAHNYSAKKYDWSAAIKDNPDFIDKDELDSKYLK